MIMTVMCLLICFSLVLSVGAMILAPYSATFQIGPLSTVFYNGKYYELNHSYTSFVSIPLVEQLFKDNSWDIKELNERNKLLLLNGKIYFSKFPDGGGYDFLISEEQYLFEKGRELAFERMFPQMEPGGPLRDAGSYYLAEAGKENTWYQNGIFVGVREGFFSGYEVERTEDGRIGRMFYPERTMTRAEVLSTVTRSDFPAVRSYGGEFTDVPETAWYYDCVKRAYEAGLIEADSEMFDPDGPATREFTALVLSRAMNGGTRGDIVFNDVSELSPECLVAAELLVGSGIIGGYEDGSFRPQRTVTRAEYAVMLKRILEKGLYASKTPMEAFAEEFVRVGKEIYGEEFTALNASKLEDDFGIPFPFYG